MRCQLMALATNFDKINMRFYPGEVISNIMNKTTGATYQGDTAHELNCYTANATLIRSLKYENMFSTRPLVYIKAANGETITGQIGSSGIAYTKIRFLERYHVNRVFTFRVNGIYYR